MANGNGDGGAPTDQTFYRQYLQSQAPDGSTTVREIVSPTLLDADAAAAHEAAAGRTFTGFMDPSQMAAAQPAAATPPPDQGTLLPSAVAPPQNAVVPTGLPAPADVAPPSALWKAVGPAAAIAGGVAAPLLAPEGALALPVAMGVQGLASGGGALVQALGEGKPLPTALKEAAVQGVIGAGTQGVMSYAAPYIEPVVSRVGQAVSGRMGPLLENLGVLQPVLGGAQPVEEAAGTVSSLASDAADALRASTNDAFNAARGVAPDLPISTAGAAPYAQAATNAMARAGVTPATLNEFGTLVGRVASDAPVPYAQLAGAERQLENWITNARAAGAPTDVVESLTNLHRIVGTQIDGTVLPTPAGPARVLYNAVRSNVNPTRFALADVQAAAPGADLATTLARNPTALPAMIDQADPAQRLALGQAWLTSTRAAAQGSQAPVTAMTTAYDALGAPTQRALFGEAHLPLSQVMTMAGQMSEPGHMLADAILTAGGGGLFGRHAGIGLGVRGGLDVAAPWLAGQSIVSPTAAGFGGALGGTVLPAAARGATQLGAERTGVWAEQR